MDSRRQAGGIYQYAFLPGNVAHRRKKGEDAAIPVVQTPGVEGNPGDRWEALEFSLYYLGRGETSPQLPPPRESDLEDTARALEGDLVYLRLRIHFTTACRSSSGTWGFGVIGTCPQTPAPPFRTFSASFASTS